MVDIAVTGGIGSGKSTVAEMLSDKLADMLSDSGGVHLNADAIVHELQQPGGEVFQAMVKHFGEGVLAADGSLNRQAVADIVFNDEAQLKALNEIVHPAVRTEMQRRRDKHLAEGSIVISEIPLLVESRLKAEKAGETSEEAGETAEAESETGKTTATQPNFAGVVVVTADPEVVLDRLAARGVTPEDAKSRMKNQASDEERLAVADFVIDNSGTLEALSQEIERCWQWIMSLKANQP